MKAMTMGRTAVPPPRPEEADSWGEFHARLEMEMERASRGNPLTPVWWALGGALFGVGLISNAYAYQGGHWVLWLCMLGSLAVVFFMAVRAVERADKVRAREAELAQLRDAWYEHVQDCSPGR
jgi:fatty acid desaturase